MVLKIFVDYLSQPCRAIGILLKLHDVKFEEVYVSLRKGEHKKDDFARLNPIMKVPAITDGGVNLTECCAILRYLVATQPNIPQEWYPADIRQRALVDEYLSWQHTGMRRHGILFYMSQAGGQVFFGRKRDPEEVKENMKSLEGVLDQIENYFLSRGNYIAGDTMTLADLVAICEMMQPVSVGYDVTKGRPLLKAWFARVKARLQPHFDELNKTIFDMSAPYQL